MIKSLKFIGFFLLIFYIGILSFSTFFIDFETRPFISSLIIIHLISCLALGPHLDTICKYLLEI